MRACWYSSPTISGRIAATPQCKAASKRRESSSTIQYFPFLPLYLYLYLRYKYPANSLLSAGLSCAKIIICFYTTSDFSKSYGCAPLIHEKTSAAPLRVGLGWDRLYYCLLRGGYCNHQYHHNFGNNIVVVHIL